MEESKICCMEKVNTLQDNKDLALPKLKEFADDNFSVAQMLNIFSHQVENIAGKRENAGQNEHNADDPKAIAIPRKRAKIKMHTKKAC